MSQEFINIAFGKTDFINTLYPIKYHKQAYTHRDVHFNFISLKQNNLADLNKTKVQLPLYKISNASLVFALHKQLIKIH